MKYDLSQEMDIVAFKTRLEYLLNKRLKVELKQIRQSRSIKHNAYLHVCITLFAIEFGYTLVESKTLLKRECSFMIYEKSSNVFLKQTSKMNSKELTDFIDWIRIYASRQGLYIPTSKEYLENKFNIDRQIDSNRTYF
jgi:hypothetical protein